MKTDPPKDITSWPPKQPVGRSPTARRLKRMTPEAIEQARHAGALDEILGRRSRSRSDCAPEAKAGDLVMLRRSRAGSRGGCCHLVLKRVERGLTSRPAASANTSRPRTRTSSGCTRPHSSAKT